MGRIRILAGGESPRQEAQARGRLFEKLITKVLECHGYLIDRTPATNYAGMEIDIEGKHKITDVPLYAECKCHETDIGTPELRGFFGIYMTQWLKDKRCHGLFLALPGINSHAKGFYNDNIKNRTEITFKVLQEKEVLDSALSGLDISNPELIGNCIPHNVGRAGDWELLYTDKGLFWLQYIIPPGGGVPDSIMLFDDTGQPLLDGKNIEYLRKLLPELRSFALIPPDSGGVKMLPNFLQDRDEVVEVQGSSAPFEYQYPASPEYFVGRSGILQEIDDFIENVMNKTTSFRSILLEANSGWGKSSVILASAARIKKKKNLAIIIDSRSASSAQFVLQVIDYIFVKLKESEGLLPDNTISIPETITGFEGGIKSLVEIGKLLERYHRIIFLFFDQFENIFFLGDVLNRIRELVLKIQEAQTNIILGFSWKADLVSLTSDFPYQTRDIIKDLSKPLALGTFSREETDALLDSLRREIRAPLRSDLRFLLSESSQGYPWHLKKLCAHVKFQRDQGVSQGDIARGHLNIEELFQEDVRNLSAQEEEALHRIAKATPISVKELGEEFQPNIIQSLIHRRLIVRIGSKYDVYWDIFRDYLNTGSLPVQENYILRTQVGTLVEAIKLLADKGGQLSIHDLVDQTRLSERTFYNVLRDMRLLKLVEVKNASVELVVDLSTERKTFEETIRDYLRERLKRNRIIWKIQKKLEQEDLLHVGEISRLLKEYCPYISARDKTWDSYARIFAGWMDAAMLATFDVQKKILSLYVPETDIRSHLPPAVRRSSLKTLPSLQYGPIEEALIEMVEAVQRSHYIELNEIRWKRTHKLSRTLLNLEQLGFIERMPGRITIKPEAIEFVRRPEKRPILFAEGALKIESFSIFVDILKRHQDRCPMMPELCSELKEKLGIKWKDSTAKWYIRIMLNWVRAAKLLPGI